METNQMMSVRIGSFGVINIGHKTGIAKVSDVLTVGNQYRVNMGDEPITSLQSYFRKLSTWRTIIEIHNKLIVNSNEPTTLAEYLAQKDKKGNGISTTR